MQDSIGKKRHRPGDSTDGEIFSRLSVSPTDFGKIIGKGGQTVTNIRSKCGVNIKGSDINEDKRLVVISGKFLQVCDAFDHVSDIMFSGCGGNDILTIHLMIEHSKAGRVVGAKGSNIMSLKNRSGALNLRMNKDAEDVGGIQLRDLAIEGTLSAIRRTHYNILEMFYEHQRPYDPLPIPSQAPPPGFLSAPMPVTVPFSSLPSLGLHGDVVSRLRELQSYLVQMGLDLQVVDTRPSLQRGPTHGSPLGNYADNSAYAPMPSPYTAYTPPLAPSRPRNHQPHQEEDRLPREDEVGFFIPKDKAGALIGRGGQGLRDLMTETGCKIRVGRTEVNGKRRVIVSNENEAVMLKAKEAVLQVVSAASS